MDPIKRAVVRDLRHVSMNVQLNELVRILQRNSFVLIDDKYFVTFSDIFDLRAPPSEEIDLLRAELKQLKESAKAPPSKEQASLVASFSLAAVGVVSTIGAAVGAAAFSWLRKR